MYNPANDPYYISNLATPVDAFIAEALEGVTFTNIVHIVLESMRSDSYPFNEFGPLANYVNENYGDEPHRQPITTSNVTPFIASLAEHTISWETVWATIAYTHKAMLGRISTIL